MQRVIPTEPGDFTTATVQERTARYHEMLLSGDLDTTPPCSPPQIPSSPEYRNDEGSSRVRLEGDAPTETTEPTELDTVGQDLATPPCSPPRIPSAPEYRNDEGNSRVRLEGDAQTEPTEPTELDTVGQELSQDVLPSRKLKAKTAKGGFVKKLRTTIREDRGILVTEKTDERTCLEDAAANAAPDISARFGVELDTVELYSLWSKTEDTPFRVVEKFFDRSGLLLDRCTAEYLIGGPAEVNLLCDPSCMCIVQFGLTINDFDKAPDFHCVYYDGAAGLILDNYCRSKPVVIQPADRVFCVPPTREEKQRAYGLWRHVSPSFKQLRTRIHNVYRILPKKQ